MSVAIGLFVSLSFFYQQHVSPTLHPALILGLREFFKIGFVSLGLSLSLLFLAVCAGIYIVPLYAILQHRTQTQYLSRVIAATNILNALFMVVASVFTIGLFALQFNVLQVFLSIGFLNIPVFFIIQRIVNNRLKNA